MEAGSFGLEAGSFGLEAGSFVQLPWQVRELLSRRVTRETAWLRAISRSTLARSRLRTASTNDASNGGARRRRRGWRLPTQGSAEYPSIVLKGLFIKSFCSPLCGRGSPANENLTLNVSLETWGWG